MRENGQNTAPLSPPSLLHFTHRYSSHVAGTLLAIKRPRLPLAAAHTSPAIAFGRVKGLASLRLRHCSCSTFKLYPLGPLLTFSTTSLPLVLSSKKEVERALFLSPQQTLDSPELQLPHRTLFVVLPLGEEESGRPRPTPTAGFTLFKPP